MRVRMLGARGRVVQNGIGEAHVFLLTRAPWAKLNGSVYCQYKFTFSPYWKQTAAILQEQHSRPESYFVFFCFLSTKVFHHLQRMIYLETFFKGKICFRWRVKKSLSIEMDLCLRLHKVRHDIFSSKIKCHPLYHTLCL